MSPEQKAAAVERLAKAREKRLLENPPKYANVHQTVLDKSDEDTFSRKNVLKWIKTQKELLSVAKGNIRRKVKGAEAEAAGISAYIRHCETYLRNGDWVDNYYGEHMSNKVQWRCTTMAYYPDGTPKRSVGIFYPDIGMVWEKDMVDG